MADDQVKHLKNIYLHYMTDLFWLTVHWGCHGSCAVCAADCAEQDCAPVLCAVWATVQHHPYSWYRNRSVSLSTAAVHYHTYSLHKNRSVSKFQFIITIHIPSLQISQFAYRSTLTLICIPGLDTGQQQKITVFIIGVELSQHHCGDSSSPASL